MQKNKKHKGFTLTELAIVIAVIAILIAVLVPTFVAIINQAKESADTQTAKDMNTVLEIGSNGEDIEDFSEVVEILQDGGYILSNLNPSVDGNYYAWDKETNQILYLDSGFNVLYYVKTLVTETINANWYFAVSTTEIRNTVITAGGSVVLVPKSEDLLSEVSNLTGEQTVYVQSDITISDASTEAFKITGSEQNITFELSSTVTINETATKFGGNRAFQVDGGATLNINGGTIIAENSGTGAYGTVKALGGSTVNITGSTLVNSRSNGMNVKVLDATANLTDVTINSTTGGCVEAGGSYSGSSGNYTFTGGTTTLDNCTFTQTGWGTSEDPYSSAVLAACYDGVLYVNSGSYTGENYIVSIFSSGGDVYLNGGTYTKTSTSNTTAFFRLDTAGGYSYNPANLYISGGEYSCTDSSGAQADIKFEIMQNCTIEITGGTFNGKDYSEYTEDNWKSMVTVKDENGNVSSGYEVSVTKDTTTKAVTITAVASSS